MTSEKSKPDTSSLGASSKRSSLIHARVRSLDLTVDLKAENCSTFVASHSRVRSLDAGTFSSLIKEEPLIREDSLSLDAKTFNSLIKENTLIKENRLTSHSSSSSRVEERTEECTLPSSNTLLGLNVDLFSTTLQYLTKEDILSLCIGSSRRCPLLWVAASGELAREYAHRAESCEEVAILTEIASQGQVAIHEEVCQANEQLAHMLNDARRYQRNPMRFDLDFQDAVALEKTMAIKFQACVGILQEVMQRWTIVCDSRDEIADFSQEFHRLIRIIWKSADKTTKSNTDDDAQL